MALVVRTWGLHCFSNLMNSSKESRSWRRQYVRYLSKFPPFHLGKNISRQYEKEIQNQAIKIDALVKSHFP